MARELSMPQVQPGHSRRIIATHWPHGSVISILKKREASTQNIDLNVRTQPVNQVGELAEFRRGHPIEGDGDDDLLIPEQLNSFYAQIKIALNPADEVICTL